MQSVKRFGGYKPDWRKELGNKDDPLNFVQQKPQD